MNREPMTTHQYENNGMGANICKVCGHLQTIPDWPFECSKVVKEPMDFESKVEKFIAELNDEDNRDDNELIHQEYDEIVRAIARGASPELMKKLDEAVREVTFWYA